MNKEVESILELVALLGDTISDNFIPPSVELRTATWTCYLADQKPELIGTKRVALLLHRIAQALRDNPSVQYITVLTDEGLWAELKRNQSPADKLNCLIDKLAAEIEEQDKNVTSH